MCASVYSSLFLHILIIVTVISTGMKMSTDGLPFDRQERGIDDNYNNDDYNDDGGLLAGEDFLSVFMRSTFKEIYQKRPTTTTTEPTTEYSRETRSLTEQTEANLSLYHTTISDNINNNNNNNSNSEKSSDNSDDRTVRQDNEEFVTVATTSEQLPSLIVESNKHNFGVEEIEPITIRRDLIDYERNNNNDGYPAKIQPLAPNQFHQHHQQSTSSFITQQYENDNDKIHQTVIFHDNPNNTGRARSVSYSTVIQALPNTNFNKKQYDFDNSTDFQEATIATTVPSTTPTISTTLTTTPPTTTERRNWDQLPVIYNMPEQNYEVDESVSVMTNGRIHGVQTSPPPSPTPLSIITQFKDNNKNVNVSNNNNNKVGYVVQGRNYRKYRVEERTSDGFIVGEYGVVSNDDGTLRGVRYTADGTISRRLIQDALMKFLSL